ncbi:hypothetical protein Micbo1qcDRAFT_179671 [Microdochium bolleyi]|uniref:Uncharacterized protein n=1 Tax=Microdochium bolleyi TaxID=196109 RepID=A0A136IP36_9PEZI|nr:hypothetical protein Micbo1qcDRAFT_179671 [Microdochium bolleyi]
MTPPETVVWTGTFPNFCAARAELYAARFDGERGARRRSGITGALSITRDLCTVPAIDPRPVSNRDDDSAHRQLPLGAQHAQVLLPNVAGGGKGWGLQHSNGQHANLASSEISDEPDIEDTHPADLAGPLEPPSYGKHCHWTISRRLSRGC